MKYLIVIEKTKTGFGAYSPDLDGCIAAAGTRAGVRKLMREAIEFHLEGMRLDGCRAPRPTSSFDFVEVTLPKAVKRVRREAALPAGMRSATAARHVERGRSEAAVSRKRP